MFFPSSSSPTPEPSWIGDPRRSLHARISEALHYFSDEIETRRVGGLGEAQAAGYVAGRLRRADYAASVQTFRVGTGEHGALAIIALVAALTAGVAAAAPDALWTIIAWAIAALALALFLAETGTFGAGSEPLRRLFGGITSQSVVAARAATSRQVRWRVIVLAPLDGPPIAALPRQGLLALLAALIANLIAIGGALITAGPGWRIAAGAGAAILLMFGVILLITSRRPRVIPAVHGAGELATLLMIAEELPRLEQVEVWMVALGGGSVGSASFRTLIEHYPFRASDTWIVNLHNITAGQPVYATREGMLREWRSASALLALASDIDIADRAIDAEPRRLRTHTIVQPFMRHGFRTLTVTSAGEATPFASPDLDTITRCLRLVAGIIRGLDG